MEPFFSVPWRFHLSRVHCSYKAKLCKFWTLMATFCYHIHKTIKQFCKRFECFVEKWIDDIHWDKKYSTDILDLLKEICFILNVPFRKPQRVSHCWLSVFNCLSIDIALIDMLILYYTSVTEWLSWTCRGISRPLLISMIWVRKLRP